MCTKYLKHTYLQLRQRLFYSVYFRFIIQNYLLLAILSVIIVYEFLWFDGWMQITNSALGSVTLAFLIIVPLLILRFFRRNKERLFDEEIAKKYDTLYENASHHPMSYMYVILFMTRRLIFSVTLQYFGLFNQITINMICSLLLLTFYSWVKPMNSGILNFVEIINESTFLLCLNMCYLFTNLIPSDDQQYYDGWFFILVVLINVALNFLILIVQYIQAILGMMKAIVRKIRGKQHRKATQ